MNTYQPAVEIDHLRKTYGTLVALDGVPAGLRVQAGGHLVQEGEPRPAAPLLVLTGYAVLFGFLAMRFFRWE